MTIVFTAIIYVEADDEQEGREYVQSLFADNMSLASLESLTVQAAS